MAIHMSIRLAWHSDGWNGHICKKPCENTFCIGQHSYPGDLIAGTRDLEFESEHAGEPCSKYPCGAACGFSVNAFGKDAITVKVDPPSFWKAGDADSINITLPPSTVCTWCYEAMYNDDVETKGESSQKYNYDKRKAGAEKYFSQFEPERSLIFYYAGYSNPFSENEENNYVIVGVSRVKKIDNTYYYDNTSEEVKRKYSGGFVWQKPVTSTYPDEGFCIPYWKYMDDEELIERLVIKPQNRSPFKYGSREVSNDDAIEVINQLIAVVDTLIEIEDDTEDWSKRKEWLNSVLNELWTARGPFPGFPSVMESLGLHDFVSKYIGVTVDSEMKQFRDDVRDFLEGSIDEVADIAPSKSDIKKIRREYQLFGKETTDFMFDVLSRFDLRADQVRAIISDDRENVSITASIAEMAENPYIIFEQYIGYDSDDTIPFYKIDNGVIPSPEYGIDEILDNGSTERFRAFCVDELNRIAAHSFGKAETILQVINARIDRLPEWKRYVYKMQNFNVEQDILDGALVQKKDEDDVLYLYLKSTYEDERTVEQALRALAERADIQLKMAITPEKFKKGLKVEDSPLVKKAPDEYETILDHQADICMQIFAKPLCVLSGAAGTGKTTVIRIKGIDAAFIEMQEISWLHEFYKWLSETKHRTEIIADKPIFLDQNRKAAAAFDDEEQLILFLPVKDVEGYKVVHEELLRNKDTLEFIKSIGIKQPSLKDQIYNIILPQYTDGADIDTDPHFMIFFNYYCKCSNEEIEEFVDLIKGYDFLTFYEDGEAYRGKASEMYMPTEDLVRYFESKPSTRFIDIDNYKSSSSYNYRSDGDIRFIKD